jgi:LysR family transcriptional regulator, transcriptional activator for bauABCD operon
MTRRASSLDDRALFAGDLTRQLGAVGDAELRLLRVFSVVVQAQGLSAASAELQLDLSSVSRQFKELETRVGVRLARRGRSGFTLTPEGEQLHALTHQLFAALHSFGTAINQLAGQAQPVLRLGLVDALLSAPDSPLRAALAHCAQALPGLQVQLRTLKPIEIERQLLAGELDAGIVAARPAPTGLVQHRLYSERSQLYVGPGHPWYQRPTRSLTAQDLAQASWVADPFWRDLPHAELAHLPTSPTHADSIEGVALLVASGQFAGFLPEHLVTVMPVLAALRAVLPQRFGYTQDMVMTCRAGKLQGPLKQWVASLQRSLDGLARTLADGGC